MDLNWLREVTKDAESAIKFLRDNECLRRSPPKCPECDRNMNCIKNQRFGLIWRCPTHKEKKVSIRKGSFFENSKIPLPNVRTTF